ncbi:MAG: DEAD/DEAH box helicase [DPANN group archaeon]|nr:DEAD/DEAH box helicase [DPANN group archaeon]
MTEYLNHPLLKKDTIQRRKYQENIIASCSKKNSLVILPTGIGKTIIAIGIVAHRLGKYKEKKALIMAPTKPLVEQHLKSFTDVMDTKTDAIGAFEILTGKVSPKKREDIYKDSRIIFATPQVIENDIINNRIDLSQYSIIVFDEAHRTSGDYAYTFIAKRYIDTPQKEQLILGLTASPGGTKEKIGAICGNLYCENVEIRDENDWDVKPYIKETKINWVQIPFPEELKKISTLLETAKTKKIKFLISMNILKDTQPSKRELLELSGKMRDLAIQKQDPIFFKAISDVAACIKLNHAIELIQTQGIPQLETYIEKLKKDNTKASMTLLSDNDVKQASILTTYLASKDTKHPKLIKAKELAKESVRNGKKTILFAHYISTVDLIIKELADEKTLKAVKFIGQRKGNTQKKQKETLDKFRNGTYNVLVATSVAEEGLDIPKVDTVIFYEPIPSEIRTIQRRGRTGREKEGIVHILMTKGTIDESYYWSTRHKEKKMKIVIDSLKKSFNNTGVELKRHKNPNEQTSQEQKSLKNFKKEKNNNIKIYVDHREPKLIKKLTETNDIETISKQLAVGDIIISDRVGIERKEVGDFLQSIIDQRLFKQMTELKDTFERPILILEGKNLYGIRNIHPNAIRGALASIACDFGIPIVSTRDLDDTKDMIIALARREQGEKRDISLRGTKRTKTTKEKQEYIISGFPDINIKLSQRILERFGTIKKFVNCKEKTLEEIEGLGKEKAKKIKEIIDMDYNDRYI